MAQAPIQGYVEQSAETVALVNANKQLEERILRQLDGLKADGGGEDQRWLAIARTHIEQGFGAWNRALLKPQRVKLEGD
jgi:hypothetical protein